MQTFVPSVYIKECAKCLDVKRLGKQRVEADTILKANKQGSKVLVYRESPHKVVKLYGSPLIEDGCNIIANTPWYNHPATKMWRNYDKALEYYLKCIIEEWISRGYNNNMYIPKVEVKDITLPPWWGSKIHRSHRSALLFKDHSYYSQFDWKDPVEYNYYWPV